MGLNTELKRRKQEERIRYFRPTTPDMPNAFNVPSNDQDSFFRSTATERWILGGNRSGKTEAAVADCIMFATGTHPVRSEIHPPPVKIRYCAPSYEDGIHAVVLPKFEEMVKREDLRGGSFDSAWSERAKTLMFANGSRINFKSFAQLRNKFGGADLHAVYSDEHGPRSYYVENKARLTDYGGFFVSSMTPEEGSITWERKHLKRRQDIVRWTFSSYGNPHLNPEGVRELERSIDDPRVLRVKLYGEFSSLSGLIYEQFDPAIHIVPPFEIPNHWEKLFVLDPHLKKASAMLWLTVAPKTGNVYIYRAHKEFLIIDQLKKFIRVKSGADQNLNLFICDEAMGGDGENIFGEKSVVEQLKGYPGGFPFVGTNQSGTKAFASGVNRVREMLNPHPVTGKPSLFLVEGSDMQGVVDEFEEYQFAKEGPADEVSFRERVRKIDDDYMDCLRYGVMSVPVTSTGLRVESGLKGCYD